MVFFLVLIVALSNQPRNFWQGREPICHVRGSITDPQMVGVGDAKVEFTTAEKRFIAHAAVDGTYSLFLPLGNYKVDVEAQGYCPYTQDVAIAKAEGKKTFDFALLDCSDCTNMIIDFVEPRIEPDVAPPNPPNPGSFVFKYQQEKLDDGRSTELKPSVLFGRRSDAGEFTEYTGLDCPGKKKLAVLRYSGGSLRAAKLQYAKEAHKVKGEGDVTVVDRRGVTRGSTVEVDLASEAPTAVIVK